MSGDSTLNTSSHLKPDGGVHMVDVSQKPVTQRKAVAAGRVLLGQKAFEAPDPKSSRKGRCIDDGPSSGHPGR